MATGTLGWDDAVTPRGRGQPAQGGRKRKEPLEPCTARRERREGASAGRARAGAREAPPGARTRRKAGGRGEQVTRGTGEREEQGVLAKAARGMMWITM